MKTLLTARNLLLFGAIALGLLLGERVAPLDPLAMPILMLIMTVSLSGLPWGRFRRPLDLLRPMAVGAVLNMLVLGGTTLALTWAFVDDPALRAGFVLVAAAPPGVAVIPFTRFCAGDLTISTAGLIGGFAVSPLVAPLITAAFLGEGTLAPWHLLPALFKLLVVPFVAAQLIIRLGLAQRVARRHGTVVNWGFAVIVLAAVGINRETFLGRFDLLLWAGVTAAASVFGTAGTLNALLRRAGVEREKRASLVLLGTVKMSAFSTAVGLALIGRTASVPGVLVTTFNIIFLMLAPHWLGAGREDAPPRGASIDTRAGMV
ncbi:MAG: hypothetical protein IT574_04865 [Candidatus Aureabacteria bacterium]|nr:hypothetical protein [Candidatus Auribacterota bacterium]NLW94923.1 hypothetical protein [Chlamydiota bacterium]HOE26554.1 hypothetical protein [bacterium]HQM51680.1 hypothetical protein [bacterium]